jgi:xanthine dehydrogenase accessory factor
MAVTSDGGLVGSVSGGCVETAVVQLAREVLKGAPARLVRFGVADDTAWAVGLACGGSIEVFVERLESDALAPLWEAVRKDEPVALATVVAGSQLGERLVLLATGEATGSLRDPLRIAALGAARTALDTARPVRVREGDADLFAVVMSPAPTLVIVGGVHIAVALVALARTMGYRTIVVDPRTAFGNSDRFPTADRIETAWPDQALAGLPLSSSTAVAVLTHDPKLDDPALRAALVSPAFYVGALGSQKTQAKRRARLLDGGIPAERLDRLRAPIGIDLGGRRPEEIALSVMAEIVAARNGRPVRDAQP